RILPSSLFSACCDLRALHPFPTRRSSDLGRHVAAGQHAFELRVQAGDLAQEGGVVVAQRILDLVGHGELGEAQHARLPKLCHARSEEHTSELQSRENLVCRLLLEKKKKIK